MGRRSETDRLARVRATDVAFVYGVTAQAVGLWHRRDGCPRNTDGTYDLRVVERWREERRSAEAGELLGGSGSSPGLEAYRKVKTEQERLKLEEMRGRLIEVSEVERGLVARVLAVKGVLMSVPRRLAGRLAGMGSVEVEEALRREMVRACNAFAGEERKDEGRRMKDEGVKRKGGEGARRKSKGKAGKEKKG